MNKKTGNRFSIQSGLLSGKYFLVLLIFFAAINVNAQWVQTSLSNVSSRSLASIYGKIFAGNNATGIYISTNNGQNWTQTYSENSTVYCFYLFNSKIYAGTYPAGLIVSSDSGASWTQTSIGAGIKSITSDGTNLYAAGGPVYKSSNGGENWLNISAAGDVNDIIYSGNNLIASVKTCPPHFPLEQVFYSTNQGSTWINSNILGGPWCFMKKNNIVYAGIVSGCWYYYYGVRYSTNNGVNWTQTNLSYPSISSLVYSGNYIFASGSSDSYEGVCMTNDNFNSSVWVNQGLIDSTTWDLLIHDGYLFATTQSHGVWRRPLSELTSINIISTETLSKYSLSQNYPNPFNPTTKVKFEIANSGEVKLVVYDIMGKEVQTLVNERLEPGTYETTFDGSMLASGVYFYKIITNEFSETKKMLMIK